MSETTHLFADLKPYPAYKDSGVPWLGQVPEHWAVRRIKSLFREKDKRCGDASGLLLSLTRSRGILPQSEASNRIASTEDLSKYKVCRPGDLVMNRMQGWSGMFAMSNLEGVISPDYSIFGPIVPCVVKYFELLFKTPFLVDQFAQASKGIGSGFNRLYTPEFGGIPVVAPPLLEQTAIVRYLTQVDRQIRQYIRAKLKLIRLLEEQKQAIIQHAVTSGLAPQVQFKSLGSAPDIQVNSSWPTYRLRQVAELRTEKERTDLSLLSVFLGRGVIPYDEGGGQVHKPSQDLANYQVVHQGDLVLNNQQAWRGSVGISKHHGIISPAYVVLSLAKVLDSRYADYLFQSRVMVSQYVTASKGVGDIQRDIYLPWLMKTIVPVPPMEEQIKTCAWLDQRLSNIHRQLAADNKMTSLLQELRGRMIADVTIGRLDVRSVTAGLPTEPVTEEQADDSEPTELPDKVSEMAVPDDESEEADE